MIEDRIQEWGEEMWRRAQQAAHQAAHQAARQTIHERVKESKALLLCRLVQKRFGATPDWVQARLQQAESDQIDLWAERLLEVDSLPALFEHA